MRSASTSRARDPLAGGVLVVGKGRLGAGLARALRAAGVRVRIAAGRDAASVRVREAVVVLAVGDPHIARVASTLAARLVDRIVLHVAGGLGPDVLEQARTAGAHVGVVHPLVSFADARRPPRLEGTTFVIDGAPRARSAARAIARALGARPLERPIHGPTYHAAAALSANGAAALAARAVEVLVTSLHLDRREAERAIGALLVTVGENVASVGLPRALTGPIARGDEEAVARHRAALDPSARAAYDAITPLIRRGVTLPPSNPSK